MSGQVEALLRERDGYLMYGRMDRAAQVEEQLRLLGVEVAPVVESAEVKRTARKRTGK